MEKHCNSCQEVSQRLSDFLETRRNEVTFSPELPRGSEIFAKFGTIAEILDRKTCISCADLATEIARWEGDGYWQLMDHLIIGVKAGTHQWITPLPDQPLYVIAENPGSDDDEGAHLVNLFPLERRGAPRDEWGRLFERTQFDLELVKSWLWCCDLSHGEFCRENLVAHLPANAFPSRILLVDLQEQCLVYGTLSEKFVGLSYVWGQTETLRTTSTILPDLLIPGSIDFRREDLKIPETVRDFLRLAVRLEIRYAWVDSLCIVQDGDDLQEQLNGMAAIFASTHLTIVGEGVDANHGLLGVGLGSQPRDLPCPILRLPDMPCVFKQNTVPRDRSKTWEERAWTFQEGLFSRRLLIFDSAGQITWKCSRGYWYEPYAKASEEISWLDANLETTNADWRYIGFSTLTPKWPDMRRWCELAEEYYRRKVSFDSDVANAIAGLMAVMSRVSPGGFFHGLPELFFDSFLLWDISGDSTRIDCDDIPSWSFLGWKGGNLDTFWWRTSMHHSFIDQPEENFGSDCEVGSAQWKKQSRDGSAFKYIANDLQKYRRRQPGDQPPEGWTMRFWPENGIPYFVHETVEEIPFKYPIPLPAQDGEDDLERSSYSKYLFFETQRGWLDLGPPIENSTEDLLDNSVLTARMFSLEDASGKWAGAIRLHSDSKSPNLEAVSHSDNQPGRVELIVMATGRVRNDAFPKVSKLYERTWTIPEWNCEGRPKDKHEYRFYFVLAIEWKGDTAYRTGLGRVEKDAWEELTLENIEVKLG